VSLSDLDLDLDVFDGPFDLLTAVILREEVSLAEIELGEIVIAYVEHLEASGELDLESATEFLVLIASLLELKSRLLLPSPELDEELPLGPEEAADELLARMLEYRRYRNAAGYLAGLHHEGLPYLYRIAPLPPELRKANLVEATAVYDPERLGRALGDLLKMPPAPDVAHIRQTVSLQRRLAMLRELLEGHGSFDFDDYFSGEDRLTQAVTLFALLEMYKRGEAGWSQPDLFGPIRISGVVSGSGDAGGTPADGEDGNG